MFNDSRSYGGTFKKSDHKLVVARIAYSRVRLGYKKPVKRAKRFDCANLISDKDTQSLYKQAMREKLAALPSVDNANDEMNNLFKVVRECAEETVGFKPSVPKPNFYNDPVVVGLSEERKRLTLMLNADNKSEDRSTLRAMINRSQKLITRRLKELNNNAADSLADQITNTDSSRRMFEAVRSLAKIKKCNSITVHDSNGNMIANDDAKAALLKEFYEKKFTAEDVTPLECFDGPPRPLDIPLTVFEVEKASRALKNGRATGPDGIPSELMKYADPVFYGRYAECINNSLATNTTVDVLGEGIITPLQKPKKEKGPPETTRPLTLSNCSHSVFTQRVHTACSHSVFTQRVHTACSHSVFTQRVHTACSHSVFTQRVHTACSHSVFTQRVHTACSHSVFTQRVHTACSHSVFTQRVHTACSHSVFTQRVHTACSHSVFTQRVHTACSHSVFTQRVHTACSHSVFTQRVHTACSHSVFTQRVHTACSHSVFTQRVHTACSHSVFTQRVHTACSHSVFTQRVHTACSHRPIGRSDDSADRSL